MLSKYSSKTCDQIQLSKESLMSFIKCKIYNMICTKRADTIHEKQKKTPFLHS